AWAPRITGNFSSESGRKMSPSRRTPSGMRTLTSRSTLTPYLRSDVDHWRVNMLCHLPDGFPLLQALLDVQPHGPGNKSRTLVDSSGSRAALTAPGRRHNSSRMKRRFTHAHHRSALLSQHRALDKIPGSLRRSAGEVLEPRVDVEKRSGGHRGIPTSGCRSHARCLRYRVGDGLA